MARDGALLVIYSQHSEIHGNQHLYITFGASLACIRKVCGCKGRPKRVTQVLVCMLARFKTASTVQTRLICCCKKMQKNTQGDRPLGGALSFSSFLENRVSVLLN